MQTRHANNLPTSQLAPDETVILLRAPPLPLVGVSIGMERGCQQNDSLADGYRNLHGVVPVRVHADLRGDVLKGTQPEVIGAI